jgi:hypothetical protein
MGMMGLGCLAYDNNKEEKFLSEYAKDSQET